MKKWLIAAFIGAMLISVPAFAQTKQTYDFSDIQQPFLKLPFEVTRTEVQGTGIGIKHVYHIADGYDAVIKKLAAMFDKGQTFEEFVPMGLNKQSEGYYLLTFGFRNEHHHAEVRHEGAGTKIIVDAMPSSYLSGRYDTAIYGYTLPDGSVLSAVRANEE